MDFDKIYWKNRDCKIFENVVRILVFEGLFIMVVNFIVDEWYIWLFLKLNIFIMSMRLEVFLVNGILLFSLGDGSIFIDRI